MQPENIQPSFGPEQPLPAEVPRSEHSAEKLDAPETGVERGTERREQVADAQAAVVGAVATPLPAADPITATTSVDVAAPSTAVGPAVADDADVIEKEWVDKAKDIVTKTKDDPFARGEQVGQLQKDYQKKRYGRELGVA